MGALEVGVWIVFLSFEFFTTRNPRFSSKQLRQGKYPRKLAARFCHSRQNNMRSVVNLCGGN